MDQFEDVISYGKWGIFQCPRGWPMHGPTLVLKATQGGRCTHAGGTIGMATATRIKGGRFFF